jgi:hypothetical protein
MKTKICKTCNIEKPISEFYPQSDKRYYNPNCKVCCRKSRIKSDSTLYLESIPEEFKVCSNCGEIKLLEDFYNDKKVIIKRASRCKKCVKQKNLVWINNNKEKYLDYQQSWKFQTRYNISLNDFNKLLKKQNGVCAICGKPELSTNGKDKIRKLSVDHNHVTGKVRGLLCGSCNLGFGSFKENIDMLKSAIKYARRA